MINIIIGKKYISKFSSFLVPTKNTDCKYYLSVHFSNNLFIDLTTDACIKLKPNVVFYIYDVVSYCHNEGGVNTYDVYLYFPKKIK